MEYLIKTTLIGLFFGTFGTTIGGIIGICFKKTSKKFLSFILAFASGLMLAIVCFDLIPEAMEIAKIIKVIIGIIAGIIVMLICDILVEKKFSNNKNKTNNLLKTGIIVSIGLALHNLPEGLAIGSGFGASITLGYSLAIAICLHDIPEGISMSVPMKNGGMNPIKVIIYVILSRSNNWYRSIFRCISRRNIRTNNSNVSKLCSRSDAVYSIRRINTRSK